jgi:shikimate kinase
MTVPLCVIVGPPGSGKTSVGRRVADRLDVGFRDTDADIEAERRTTIADIFVDEGEDAFRGYERAAVRRALAEHDGVLSLGGGAVIDAETRELLKSERVVFLNVGLAAAAKRVGLARDRPVLAANPRSMLAKLLDERRPLYHEVATITIDTDTESVDEITDRVIEGLHLEVPTS